MSAVVGGVLWTIGCLVGGFVHQSVERIEEVQVTMSGLFYNNASNIPTYIKMLKLWWFWLILSLSTIEFTKHGSEGIGRRFL